jgi:hypothetical protein
MLSGRARPGACVVGSIDINIAVNDDSGEPRTIIIQTRSYSPSQPLHWCDALQVVIEPPGLSDSVSILRGLRARLERHHGVRVSDAALTAAVNLSDRYIPDRYAVSCGCILKTLVTVGAVVTRSCALVGTCFCLLHCSEGIEKGGVARQLILFLGLDMPPCTMSLYHASILYCHCTARTQVPAGQGSRSGR